MEAVNVVPAIWVFFLLALAVTLLAINTHTYRSRVAKNLSYYGMWAAIVLSIVVMIRGYGV